MVRVHGGMEAGRHAARAELQRTHGVKFWTAQSLGSSPVIGRAAPLVAKLARSAMVDRPSSEAIPARKSSTLS